MIQAELHRKLGRDGTLAHSRSEDLLTSTVFGLIKHLPTEIVLLPLLERARRAELKEDAVEVQSDAEWMRLTGVRASAMTFWPRWQTYGEPDLLVKLLDGDGRVVHKVVIEAKLYSPKSNRAQELEEIVDGQDSELKPASSDQLVRYWQYLQRPCAENKMPATLVYLTAHSSPPGQDLRESLLKAPHMRLAWLSWRDIWTVLGHAPVDGIGDNLRADLIALLECKGLAGFDGFGSLEPPELHSSGAFFGASKYFEFQFPHLTSSGVFYD